MFVKQFLAIKVRVQSLAFLMIGKSGFDFPFFAVCLRPLLRDKWVSLRTVGSNPYFNYQCFILRKCLTRSSRIVLIFRKVTTKRMLVGVL